MVNYFFSKFVKCNQDKLFIAHPKNEDQLKILEAIGKALKIKYKTSDTEFNPEFLVKLKRSQKQFEQLRDALIQVVEGPGGTGARARVPGVEIAGKTGTGEIAHGAQVQCPGQEKAPAIDAGYWTGDWLEQFGAPRQQFAAGQAPEGRIPGVHHGRPIGRAGR